MFYVNLISRMDWIMHSKIIYGFMSEKDYIDDIQEYYLDELKILETLYIYI